MTYQRYLWTPLVSFNTRVKLHLTSPMFARKLGGVWQPSAGLHSSTLEAQASPSVEMREERKEDEAILHPELTHHSPDKRSDPAGSSHASQQTSQELEQGECSLRGADLVEILPCLSGGLDR